MSSLFQDSISAISKRLLAKSYDKKSKSKDKGGSQERIANSYCGNLIENFDYDKTIYKAVEVTSGHKLFYQIVENDKIGIKIVQEMNRQQLPGEVTFLLIF
ncbi:structural maintenance of chromosomes protein 3 [Nephila pilipes]|uniref:Structural maintenance of chromosomes protein 3 n=1 Tax=Nephila pilipes TaxID=299642 RepID=A0A8X6PNV7_NEPPI|nr:structural maintenance of chromosomes protein 3 [Nephila pilipes]